MKKQEYFCEACGQKGCIEYEDHADVLSVAKLIHDDHERENPQCPSFKFSDRFVVLNRILVRNPELCSEEEWAALHSQKPKAGSK